MHLIEPFSLAMFLWLMSRLLTRVCKGRYTGLYLVFGSDLLSKTY